MTAVEPDTGAELPPVGSYENPADEHVGCYDRTLVVAARGPFGIIRAVQVGSLHTARNAPVLKSEVAKFVGLMTEGVYWSQHVYEGTPWYTRRPGMSMRDAREAANGIWLWKWAEPRDDAFAKRAQQWDNRRVFGDEGWTACTDREPTKLADLPPGF